ncbi:MAG: creatininase [Ardenticatenaceae bacterium]|nr:creatininase [Ardenticatenaceae bacterium]HBY97374.1 creatininase [Chloroflexota bacterium]
MARSAVRMDELTWAEYHRKVEAGAPVILVCAATEQHGPHLPLGTDVMQAREIAERAAETVGAVVAPPLPYGYKSQPMSGGGQSFPGTTSLDGETLILLVRDILSEFIRHGVRRVAVMDAHYENTWFLIEGIDLALRRTQSTHTKILHVPFTALISDATVQACFPEGFPGWATEHAAVLETSMMAVARPELVRWELIASAQGGQAQRIPPYNIYPPPPDIVAPSGSLAPPAGGSREKGELLIEEAVRSLVEILADEFGLRIRGSDAGQ